VEAAVIQAESKIAEHQMRDAGHLISNIIREGVGTEIKKNHTFLWTGLMNQVVLVEAATPETNAAKGTKMLLLKEEAEDLHGNHHRMEDGVEVGGRIIVDIQEMIDVGDEVDVRLYY
jgi:hypothetical protein